MPKTSSRLLPLLLLVIIFAGAFSAVPRASAQSTANVKIQNFAFSPATITVVIGVNNTVTWTNMDSATHTVTADGGSFGSSDLSSGQTFTFTFTTAGSYSYHCSIHTYMKGTVVVVGSSSTTTSSSSSSTTTTTTSASTTGSASTTSPSTTTSPGSSSGGVPEFPFQGILLAAVTLALLASYFAIRRGVARRNPAAPALP